MVPSVTMGISPSLCPLSTYAAVEPYSYTIIERLCNVDRMVAIKQEITRNLRANFKGTDLFKLYRTMDLANLGPAIPPAIKREHVYKVLALLTGFPVAALVWVGRVGLKPYTSVGFLVGGNAPTHLCQYNLCSFHYFANPYTAPIICAAQTWTCDS